MGAGVLQPIQEDPIWDAAAGSPGCWPRVQECHRHSRRRPLSPLQSPAGALLFETWELETELEVDTSMCSAHLMLQRHWATEKNWRFVATCNIIRAAWDSHHAARFLLTRSANTLLLPVGLLLRSGFAVELHVHIWR